MQFVLVPKRRSPPPPARAAAAVVPRGRDSDRGDRPVGRGDRDYRDRCAGVIAGLITWMGLSCLLGNADLYCVCKFAVGQGHPHEHVHVRVHVCVCVCRQHDCRKSHTRSHHA